jgi:general secretion pathway protein D
VRKSRSPLVSLVLVAVLIGCPPGPAPATPAEPLHFENAEVSTVVKHVGKFTGITFLFDPEQVKGRITLLSPRSVSPEEAVEILKSALGVHGYRLVSSAGGMLIVPAERLAPEAVTVRLVTLEYASAGEVAYTLRWVAPAGVRIVPYYPTNSLVISGPPAAVETLIDIIR